MTWQDQIAQIVNDRQSGALSLSSAAALALIALSNESSFSEVGELLKTLEKVGQEILQAQTGMAPLGTLYNRVLFAVAAESDVASAIIRLRETAEAYLADQERASAELSRRAVALIPHGVTVATCSHSSTVETALKLAAQDGRSVSVICHESRPMCEGFTLAAALAEANIPVTLAVDAAMFTSIRGSEMVIVGADAVAETGIVGKVGTAAMATCAKWLGVPCYVLASSNKIWPSALGSQPIKEHPASEIWDNPPAGVTVTNPYYDVTSWDAISGVVTEQGLMTSNEIRSLGRQRVVHPSLQKIVDRIRDSKP